MKKKVNWKATIEGQVSVEAETNEQAAEMVKGLIGASLSIAVVLYPVNTKIDMQVVSDNGLVAASGPIQEVPRNRAERRHPG